MFENDLAVITFLCKDFWTEVYGKQVCEKGHTHTTTHTHRCEDKGHTHTHTHTTTQIHTHIQGCFAA